MQVWTDRGLYGNFRLVSVSPAELAGTCDAGVEKLLRLPISQVWGVASRGRLFVPRGDSFVDAVTVYKFDTGRRKFERADRAPEAGRPAVFESGFSRLPGRVVYDPKSKDLWIVVLLRDIPQQIDPEDVGTIRTAHLTFTYDHVAGQYGAESEQQRADRRHKVQSEFRSRQYFEQLYRQGRNVPFDLFLPSGVQPPAPKANKAN
ncbi:MAG: hypothetical protein K1X57_07000 [Gemmataceae bacterium]|nr:hypothetical protein [Gemmataceae bacterium]